MWVNLSGHCKYSSKNAILDLIRFTPGGISRVELARQVGLTRAAVTTIINDLLANRIVREAERRPASAGRKPILLEINPDRGLVAGVDIGASHATLLVCDFSARVISELDVAFNIHRDPDQCLEEIDDLLRDLLASSGLSLDQLISVGIGVPGPVISEAGMVVYPPIMPGWNGYPIRAKLNELWSLPVSLSNDAELGGLGEWAYGAGRGESNIAFIKVGTGVGAGLILNGQIYSGATGCAGEIGHTTVDENGPLCACGNRGCLEAYSGGQAIANRAMEAVKKGQRTQLAFFAAPEQITSRDVIQAARSGDLTAQQIVTDAGTHLGTAIASLVNMFNPGMVIVGGRMAQIGDLLLEPIRKAVGERSLKASSHKVRISAALLGRRSAAMGAVVQALTLALHQISNDKGGDFKLANIKEVQSPGLPLVQGPI